MLIFLNDLIPVINLLRTHPHFALELGYPVLLRFHGRLQEPFLISDVRHELLVLVVYLLLAHELLLHHLLGDFQLCKALL